MPKYIAIDNTEIKNLGDPLDPILWRGRQWAVTEFGIEALNGQYYIAKERLTENIKAHSWLQYIAEKPWVDIHDFTTAWLVALGLFEADVYAQKALFDLLNLLDRRET